MTLPDFERHARDRDPPDYHLRRMAVLLEALGNPHLAVPTVHVAGSKGKGSTSAMIAAILAAHDLTVGLYTSPHLHTVRERIRTGIRSVEEPDFAKLLYAVWPHIVEINSGQEMGRVSFFDAVTAMAFLHYKNIGADFQVIEVGLGGRLDSTNLVSPIMSVITPIGLDHVAVLGNTLEEIASDKAGIIKKRVPVVMARQQNSVRSVIAARAATCDSSLHEAIEEVVVEKSEIGCIPGLPQKAILRSATKLYDLEIPLAGSHQIDNARTAIAVLEQLKSPKLSLQRSKTADGFRKLEWPARVQILSKADPFIVADGAHSPDSAIALVNALDELFPDRMGVILIYGAGIGHELRDTVRNILCLNPKVITTRSRHPKAFDAVDVAKVFLGNNVHVAAVTETVGESLYQAKKLVRPGEVIVATGSMFVAAEVIEEIHGYTRELYPTLNSSGAKLPNINVEGV